MQEAVRRGRRQGTLDRTGDPVRSPAPYHCRGDVPDSQAVALGEGGQAAVLKQIGEGALSCAAPAGLPVPAPRHERSPAGVGGVPQCSSSGRLPPLLSLHPRSNTDY